ncbi:MAG TPA: hypothetical protein VJU61_27225, partial [Polyangiaceae bacterium]|nr:hypothetical protein [Polyangiaceae bacterium]
LAPGEDDLTPPSQMGYRIELVRGEVPESMRRLIGVELAGPAPLLLRPSFDEVPSLSATLQVVAVDDAGNESAPSEPFTLAWSGCTLTATGDRCENELNAAADSDFSAGLEAASLEEVLFSDTTAEVLGDTQAHLAIAPEGAFSNGGGCALPPAAGSRSSGSLLSLAAAGLLGLGLVRRRSLARGR